MSHSLHTPTFSPSLPLFPFSRRSLQPSSLHHTYMCTATNHAQVEEAYRLAKATYKQAKAAAKALRKEEDAEAKAARKRAKAERKAAEKAALCTALAQPPIFGTRPDAAGTDVANVVVCGGKTCKKMGADVVMELLRKKEGEVGGVRGEAPCMKMCGGGGPTLRVGGEEVKLDFKNAVLAAVLGEPKTNSG